LDSPGELIYFLRYNNLSMTDELNWLRMHVGMIDFFLKLFLDGSSPSESLHIHFFYLKA